MIRLDEGYQYGLGAFETIAVQSGRALFLEQHLSRLSAALVFLEINQTVTDAEVKAFISAEGIADGAVKLMVSAGNIRLVRRDNPYRPEHYRRGLDLICSDIRRNETSPLVFHKTFNYGDNIIARRQAVAQGKDEALFLNSCGEICEGSVSNIFLVRAGQLYTPDRQCGLLPGIIRDWICRSYPVGEARISPEQLGDYQECFLTNSLMGIMPVRQIGALRFDKRTVTDKIAAEYHRFVKN